jgi:hypothetical protein
MVRGEVKNPKDSMGSFASLSPGLTQLFHEKKLYVKPRILGLADPAFGGMPDREMTPSASPSQMIGPAPEAGVGRPCPDLGMAASQPAQKSAKQ